MRYMSFMCSSCHVWLPECAASEAHFILCTSLSSCCSQWLLFPSTPQNQIPSLRCSDTEPGFVCLFACVSAGDGSSRTRRAMFPVSAVLAQPESIQTLPGAEAPGTGIVRKGHAGRAQEERSVQREGLRFVYPPKMKTLCLCLNPGVAAHVGRICQLLM